MQTVERSLDSKSVKTAFEDWRDDESFVEPATLVSERSATVLLLSSQWTVDSCSPMGLHINQRIGRPLLCTSLQLSRPCLSPNQMSRRRKGSRQATERTTKGSPTTSSSTTLTSSRSRPSKRSLPPRLDEVNPNHGQRVAPTLRKRWPDPREACRGQLRHRCCFTPWRSPATLAWSHPGGEGPLPISPNPTHQVFHSSQ
jgi:hypothetical protein